jgi:ABC-type transport system substrate-binding protein
MGQKDTGLFETHPSMSTSPRIQFTSSAVDEGLITTATNFSASPNWEFAYDPDLAKQLIAEAGYRDGFSITLTPSIRGAVAWV